MTRFRYVAVQATICAVLMLINAGDSRMARADDDDIARHIAPTGTLRAAINYGNIVLAQRGPDGEPAGISADLARELGRRLKVPVSFTTFDTAGKVVDALNGPGSWDVAFLAVDPKRAQTIAFTPP
ncbi:transporter substrate-binding domain-containing protein [Methylobacterium radiodurans]|uniref:transporter substrate-binding domain-containing protein n=1 Tax=Methylobacterium radiodurans TaxID=2202828 RepID=UPI00267875A6